MQSRRSSLIESATNTAIGYLVAVGAQAAIFPAFGITASAGQHAGIAAAFTAVSLVRSYVLRRVFNRWAGQDSKPES
jgi:membrane protein implicated in regulation of membrane protease activity